MSTGEALKAPIPAEETSGGLLHTLRERWHSRGDGGWGEQWSPGSVLVVGAGLLLVLSQLGRGGDSDSGEQTTDDPSADVEAEGNVEPVEGFTVDAFDVTVAAGDNIGALVRNSCESGFAYGPSVDATIAGNDGSDVIRPTDPAQGIGPLELHCLYPEP